MIKKCAEKFSRTLPSVSFAPWTPEGQDCSSKGPFYREPFTWALQPGRKNSSQQRWNLPTDTRAWQRNEQQRTWHGSLYLFPYQGEHSSLIWFAEADAIQGALHGHRALLHRGLQQCLWGEQVQVRHMGLGCLTPSTLPRLPPDENDHIL